MDHSRTSRKRKDGFFDGAVVEGADYLVDMEVSRRKKRKMGVNYRDQRWDSTYASFFVDLEKYWEAKFGEEDENDPHYAAFLGLMKEHINAYMVDVSSEHNIDSPLIYETKYEDEDETSSWYGFRTPQTRRGIDTRRNGKMNVGRQQMSGSEDYSFSSQVDADATKKSSGRSDQSSSKQEGSSNGERGLRSGYKGSGYVNSDEINGFQDISIRNSLRFCHTTTQAGSLKVTRELRTGLSSSGSLNEFGIDSPHMSRKKSIWKEGSSEDERNFESGRQKSGFVDEAEIVSPSVKTTSPKSQMLKNGRSDVRERHQGSSAFMRERSNETYEILLKSIVVLENSMFFNFGGCDRIYYEGGDQPMSTDTATEATESAPAETCTKPSTKSVSQKNNPKERTLCPMPISSRPPATLCSAQPIAIATPLTSSAKEPITSLVPRITNTESIETLDRPMLSTNASLALPAPPTHSSMSPPASKKLPPPCSGVPPLGPQKPSDKEVMFYNDLHKILRKPYCQTEYDELWKAMTLKTPIQTHRESRSGGTSRPSAMGKSYLERYPAVRLEIEKVISDSGKVLNLMRMLSFFLQKLAHGRIPMPWNDDYSKTILPGSDAT